MIPNWDSPHLPSGNLTDLKITMFNGSSIYGDFRDVNVYQRVELAMAMGHPLWDACTTW